MFDYEECGDGFLVSLRYQKQKISSTSIVPEGISEGISEGINEGINELLGFIRNEPGRRIPQLSKELRIPAKTIERWIRGLKSRGLVEYRGSNRTGGYFAKEVE